MTTTRPTPAPFVCTFPECIHHPKAVAPTLANTVTATAQARRARSVKAAATRAANKAAKAAEASE